MLRAVAGAMADNFEGDVDVFLVEGLGGATRSGHLQPDREGPARAGLP